MRTTWPVWLLLGALLAGCTETDTPLTIVVTDAPEDPRTEPYRFLADGAGDSFHWSFGPRSEPQQGREVEHLFGYTNGEVRVTVTADGDPAQAASQTLTLGTGKNTPPEPVFQASGDWVAPGELIRLSVADTTDADDDPLLVEWSCRRIGPPVPPHNDGTPEVIGLPFGYQFGPSLTDATPTPDASLGDDLCAALGDGLTGPTTISGSIPEADVYWIDVSIRDPKSQPQRGRLVLFNDPLAPAEEAVYRYNGTLVAGTGGQADRAYRQLTGEAPEDALDAEFHTMRLFVTALSGNVTLDVGEATGAKISFEVLQGGQRVIERTDQPTTLPPGRLAGQPAKYDLAVFLDQGVDVDYEVAFHVVQDRNPENHYDAPVP